MLAPCDVAVWLNLVPMTFGTGFNSAIVETWRGPVATPEHRWSPYEGERDYPGPESTQRQIVQCIGVMYGPCTGTCFGSTNNEIDIKHMERFAFVCPAYCGTGYSGSFCLLRASRKSVETARS